MKKYYLWGNGFDTWTIDLWSGHCQFKKIKEFKKTTKDPSNQANMYNRLFAKAAEYMGELSKKEQIPIAGGSIGTVVVK